MIDRDLLRDIGFQLGIGWDHEVWVYNGGFWVHFGVIELDTIPEYSANGDTMEPVGFFTKFLASREDQIHEHYNYGYND